MFKCSTVERAQYYLDQGYDINMTDKSGKNVVNRSFKDNEIDLLKFYVSKGASLMNKSTNGETIMDRELSIKVIDVIFSICSDEERNFFMNNLSTLYQIIKLGDNIKKDDIDVFIKHGFNFNNIFVYSYGCIKTKVLVYAMDFRSLKLIRCLLVETNIECDYRDFFIFCLNLRSYKLLTHEEMFIRDETIDMDYINEILDDDKNTTHKHIAQLILYKATHLKSTTKSAIKINNN